MVRLRVLGARFCFFVVRMVSSSKRRDFTAVSTERHGAPAPTVGSGVIVKENQTVRIRAPFQVFIGTFGDQFSGRPRNRGEQPFETFFSRNEAKTPSRAIPLQLIVPFRNP